MLGEARTLYPDMVETIRATEILAKEGFKPMVYCVDDPIAAKRLEDVGAVAIMPLGAPIGSGLGIQNKVTIRLHCRGYAAPRAGRRGGGHRSDAALAMELGCTGVLAEHGHCRSQEPRPDGRLDEGGYRRRDVCAYLAGRMGRRMYADPSSPLAGLI